MIGNSIKKLRDSLNEILKIDPKATFEFEDCGSGTTALNIIISKKSIDKLSMEDLYRLQDDFDICGDDEGKSVKEWLMGGNKLFICLS